MASPCALISSCSELDPTELVKNIIGNTELPESSPVIEDVHSYPWSIETKYYSAKINLCTSVKRTIGDKSFAENVHAFVVHFDSNDTSSFDKVKMWLPFLKEISPEVQILVCDRCDDKKGLCKEELWTWCLDNAFELVELDPFVDDNDKDEEDDFQETVGIKRIVQALHAHTWPNLIMKDESTFRSPYMNKMIQEEAAAKNTSDVENFDNKSSEESSNSEQNIETIQLESSTPTDTSSNDPNQLLNQDLLDSLADNEGDEESFEKLFEKLKVMKDKAESLPLEERKKYAEKIAVQFWKAIGGDEDEIEGLSDSD